MVGHVSFLSSPVLCRSDVESSVPVCVDRVVFHALLELVIAKSYIRFFPIMDKLVRRGGCFIRIMTPARKAGKERTFQATTQQKSSISYLVSGTHQVEHLGIRCRL